MIWLLLVPLVLYFGFALREWVRPQCDWCKTRQPSSKLHNNYADLGWSNSNGLCPSCAVAQEIIWTP